jgi:elongation factor 3
MSDFVKLQPQAAHYFELSVTDNLSFHFPEPGRLEGVKTSTQKFLEMEHVDFRYPNAPANSLTDIHLKMTLSSRVCVLGKYDLGIRIASSLRPLAHVSSDFRREEWRRYV